MGRELHGSVTVLGASLLVFRIQVAGYATLGMRGYLLANSDNASAISILPVIWLLPVPICNGMGAGIPFWRKYSGLPKTKLLRIRPRPMWSRREISVNKGSALPLTWGAICGSYAGLVP